MESENAFDQSSTVKQFSLNQGVETTLTPYQSIFYTDWVINPGRVDYNGVVDHILFGDLDAGRLNHSLIRLVNDYLLINSNITNKNGSAQWVHRGPLLLTDQIIQYYPDGLDDDSIFEALIQPFDVETDSLMRFYLIKYEEKNTGLFMLFIIY